MGGSESKANPQEGGNSRSSGKAQKASESHDPPGIQDLALPGKRAQRGKASAQKGKAEKRLTEKHVMV